MNRASLGAAGAIAMYTYSNLMRGKHRKGRTKQTSVPVSRSRRRLEKQGRKNARRNK